MSEVLPYMALGVSVLTLLIMTGEKLFGGGNALAAKFHALDKQVTNDIAAVRRELSAQIDEYEKVSTVGFDAIRANIHAMQIGLLEFRAEMGKELRDYIRRDDYLAGMNDVKRDVQTGFRSVDERLGQLQDLIMWANPDLQPPPRPQIHRG